MNIDTSALASQGWLHTATLPRPARTPHADAKAWAAAQDFEAQFISTMTQSMFAGIKADGPFEGGQGEDMFRSLLVDQYGTKISQSGGIGIADSIYSEILKMQEAGK
ncbi:MAG: chemotaxis protein chel [Rhizobiales bacterium]|nr:chemotaxis protein chel [Hyphomicrobiales bacterium]